MLFCVEAEWQAASDSLLMPFRCPTFTTAVVYFPACCMVLIPLQYLNRFKRSKRLPTLMCTILLCTSFFGGSSLSSSCYLM